MKPSELRTGNLILFCGEPTTVNWAMLEIISDSNFYNPIPLTEEWLLKMGVEKKDWGIITYYRPMLELDFEFTLKGVDYNIKVKTVHQLQNLYFALTGEELIIKQ